MLDAIRKRASSWVVRVLMLLLIVSFAIWGIGDIFRSPRGGTVIAEVGDLGVTTYDLNRELDEQMARLRSQLNTNIDRSQAIAFGLLQQSLQTSIARRLVDMQASDLGLGVSDAAIRTAITEDPLFRGETGFDRQRFEIVLRSQGRTEADYIAEVRNDLRRNLLIDSISALTKTPSSVASRLFAYRNEKRRATILSVDSSKLEVETPDDATLQTYLEANKVSYEAPEYRSGVLVLVRPEDLVGEVDISDDELQQAYEARLDSLTEPERRKVGQLLANSEETIQKAAAAVAGGATLAEVAQSMAGDGVSYSAIGPLALRDLPPDLGQPIFALEPDKLSEPIKSAFGWHLFRLIEAVPESVKPFAEMRQQLHDQLAQERAQAELPGMSSSLDDEIAAGSTLEDAARQLGLKTIELVEIDRSGLKKDGTPAGIDGLTGQVLAALFQAPADETSLLEQTSTGYFMYRIGKIEPPRDRTLDEVRDRLVEAWTRERRTELGREKATALLERAKAGMTLEALALETPGLLSIETVGPIGRDGSGAEGRLPQPAVAKLFATPAGDLADEVFEAAGAALILRDEEVIAAEMPESLAGIEGEIARQMRNDLLIEYESALRSRYSIKVNDAALQAFTTSLDPQL